ncbi:MAG: Ig-like domain-containing protein [Patescibacteria group bacterium]
MSKTTQSFWHGLLLPLGLVAVVGFGIFLVPAAAHALTVESVGSTLGLGSADLKQTIINIIKWALGLLGLVAVIVMLYGGFLWLTSRGDERQIDKAKRTLINGVIGLVIILLAWAIVLFVQRFVTNATTGTASAAACTTIGEVQGCVTCADAAPVGDGEGEWQPNGSCVPIAGTEDWQAVNQVPALAATNVKLCAAAVEAYGGLSVGVENNPSAGSFTVNEVVGGGAVAGTTNLGTNRTATFLHPADFKPNTEYEVTRTGFLSSSTPALPLTLPPTWKFTTGTEGDDTPPTVSVVAPTGTINCLKPELDAVFSEPMLPLSVHVDNITVSPTPSTGAKLTNIAMNGSLDGFSATFDKPLDPSVTYTVTLNAETDPTVVPSSTGGQFIKGFKDMCVKNALDGDGDGTAEDTPADDYSWTFTTANTTTVDCTPKITNIAPTGFYGNNIANGQQALIITGENFGVTGAGVLFPGTSAFATTAANAASSCFSPGYRPKQAGSVACIRPADWQPTQITTLVPAGITPSASATGPATGGAVDGGVVVQKSQSSPPSNPLDIQTPHIDWVSPADGKVGTYVTIGGTHFGNTPGRVLFRKADGTEITGSVPACAGSNGWTEDTASANKRSQIIIQVPAGFNVNDLADIQIEHSSLVGAAGRSNLHRFTVNDTERPGLCSITPQCHNAGGGTVAVVGQGIGTNLADIQSLYIPGDASKPTTNGTLSNFNSAAATLDSRAGNIGQDQYLFQLNVGGKATNPLNYKIPCLPAPAVVTDNACNLSNGTLPSPNPVPNATNVCRNIRVGIRFNQSMNPADLANTANVQMSRCDNGTTFTCTGRQPVTVAAAADTYTVANDSAIYTPSTNLSDGYWYEVTVRGAIQSATGVAVGQDYTWNFQVKTGGPDCALDGVSVLPGFQGPKTTGQSSSLLARPLTNTCSILTNATTFTWSSTDVGLAPLSTITNTGPLYNNDGLVSIVPAGSYDGTATLTASAGGKSGTGKIQVVRNYCETDDTCNAQCGGSTCDVAAKRCRPVVSDVDPVSGPAGNIVNVNGCFFGNAKGDGKVTFTGGGNSYDGSFALCGPAGWTNNQIRVQAAPDFAATGSTWNVQVQTSTANGRLLSNNTQTYSIANVCRSTTNGTVPIPASGVPIVCSITPTAAKEGATIRYAGDKFSTTTGQAFFTSAGGTANQLTLPGTSTVIGSATSATTRVPGGAGTPLSGISESSIGTPSGGDFCLATPAPFNVSCSQNAECNTGCCAANICSPLATCTEGLIQSITPAAGALSCRNAAFVVTFARDMQFGSLNSSNIQLQLTSGTVVPSTLSLSGRTATLAPTTALTNGSYQVFVRGGTAGVVSSANTYMSSASYIAGPYTVGASATICSISRTEILPTSDLFTCSGDSCAGDVQVATPGNQHSYIVQAYDANNVPLTLQAQTWTQGDSGGTGGASNVYRQGATGATCPNNSTSSTYCSESLNVPNGQEQLSVSVTGTGSSGTGNASINVRSFLCSKPWPAAPNPWPFVDPSYGAGPLGSHGFTMAYCGDNVGNVELGLPPIAGLLNQGGVLKEYFMFVQDATTGANTGDAIGVRTYINLEDLSPERWYQHQFGRPHSGSTLEVDGYPAIREGRTVYVAGTNCTNAACTAVYPNIYVFSYSDNAKADTIKIFDQLLKNIRFNTNATFSADEQAQLRRDTKRVHNMFEIVYALQKYTASHGGAYPKLASGSYLPGISVTSWPSWQQALGQELQITLPKDIAPKWDEALCPDADTEQATCWNQTAKKFTFPSDASDPPESRAILYRYVDATSISLYATMEQNTLRNSQFGVAQAASLVLASTNVCPGPSSCVGFNVRIGQDLFKDIDTAKNYSASSTEKILPVVAIDAPAAGTVVGTVDAVASATDNAPGDSGIASVRFVVTDNASKQVANAIVTTPSGDGKYHWSWNTRSLLNVQHTLTVTATDRAGNTRTATQTYTPANPPGDAQPPSVTINSPAASAVFAGSDQNLSATAIEPAAPHNSGVAKVEYYLGTSKIGQAPATACTTGCPTTYTANVTVPGTLIQQFTPGAYTFSAVAYDLAGNTSIAQLGITVQSSAVENTPPSVSIVAPASTISGTSTNVLADAADASSGVNRVEFYVDFEATPRAVDYASPYSFAWSHTGYVDGSTYAVRAVAFDYAGNLAVANQTVTYTTAAGPDAQRPTITGLTATLTNGTPSTADDVTVPLANASLKDIVTLNATLTDNVAILRAELRIDGVLVPLPSGSYFPITSPTQYGMAYSWNTLPELIGAHTVTFSVYDSSNYVTTAAANVNVDNGVTMTINQPLPNTTVQDNPTVPVVIDVSKTCRTDQLLSSVALFIDNATTPFDTITNCTNRRCTYAWTTLTSTSNGTHTLKAIGTDSAGCKGGSQVKVIVNNNVNDTTPPSLTNFRFNSTLWNTGSPVFINNGGLISVDVADNVGGSGLAQTTIAVNGSTIQTCGAVSPCQVNWAPVDGGNYTVTVNASDSDGNTAAGLSQVVNVDRGVPTGSWQSPASGSTVNTPPNVTLRVQANDPQVNSYASGIATVAFFYTNTSGALLPPATTQTAGAYVWVGQPPAGTTSYFADITDRAGNTFRTAPVTLTVGGPDVTPPTVNIIQPATDNYWQRGNILLEAFTNDVPGVGVQDVEFFVNGASLGTVTGSGNVQFNWNSASGAYPNTSTSTGVPIYSVTARACDQNNNCATSAPRLIKLSNGATGNLCGPLLCSGAAPQCCSCATFSCVPASQTCLTCSGAGGPVD